MALLYVFRLLPKDLIMKKNPFALTCLTNGSFYILETLCFDCFILLAYLGHFDILNPFTLQKKFHL